MSLFDVDTGNDKRESPSPNKVDQISQDARMSHGTISTSYSTTQRIERIQLRDNQIAGYDGSGDQTLNITPTDFQVRTSGNSLQGLDITSTAITLGDGFNQRILLGPDSTGQEVLKISMAGYDASSATNTQLLFNSNQDIFKIVSTGVRSISHNHTLINSAITTSFAHNQSQRPILVAYASNLVAPGIPGTPTYILPLTYPGISGGNLVISTLMDIHVDDTNITLATWSAHITTITSDIRYYILQETAA